VFTDANIFQIIHWVKRQKENRHMYPYIISKLLNWFKSLHPLRKLEISWAGRGGNTVLKGACTYIIVNIVVSVLKGGREG